MRLTVRHTTRYRFKEPVIHALQRVRLTPKKTQGQAIINWTTDYDNANVELEYDDQNFNHTVLISVKSGATEVAVSCNGVVETSDQAGVIGRHSGHLPIWAFLGQTRLTRPGPEMRKLIRTFEGRGEDKAVERLHALSAAVLEGVAYTKGATVATTTAEDAVKHRTGVCQDHAHIFIGAARELGHPARYVSGYLMMNDRIEQEASHAWAEAHVDGLGWVGFDVSNGISPDARYVRVATGRDYREAAPITGITFGGSEEELEVDLAVEQQSVQQ
ncbi:transglutaminase family protein [Altererythrobacter sp. CAU 1778]